MHPDSDDTSFISDLPNGPLDEYRNRAKFDWKKLKIIIEEPSIIKLKYKVWKTLENDPLFAHSKVTLSVDQQKRLAAIRMKRAAEYDFVPDKEQDIPYKEKTRYYMSVNEAMHALCPSFSVKIALGIGLFNNAILAMGTERHLKYYKPACDREITTCLAITEVSHGSNTKRIKTTAIYDIKTQEFIINSPDFEAAKCWVGNLGKTATVALLFANLYTPDGVCHGLHGFMVPIRDPNTLLAYPGVVVGDIGEKIGLNGIDNGFVMFNQYRIPRENLLNKTGDVTPDGVYESVFTEPQKILGAALESFSAGRVGIMLEAANTLSHAAVIAVRYAAIRKQFGTEKNGPEMPIIEYQLHQWRIFPYLAAACIHKVSVHSLAEIYLTTIEKSQKESNGFEILSQIVSEIHAVVSSSKPLVTWTARDAIQEAREACGGHGYLKAANLGELRNNHDPSCTYEGDNNVLGQQASNWLLRQWEGPVESPVGTVNFLKRRTKILAKTFKTMNNDVRYTPIQFVIECYEWLLCYLLDVTSKHMKSSIENGNHRFVARNDAQVYKARDLSKAYAEFFALNSFKNRCLRSPTSDLKPVLTSIFNIYGLWCIDKHLATFYAGGFCVGSEFSDVVRSELLKNFSETKNVAVSIADAISPPDFILNSVLGKSDGRLYENIQNEFMTNPGAMERATWWKDVLPIKSKL